MNVYDKTIERIKVAFDDFDNVLVAVSMGKDSGVSLMGYVSNYTVDVFVESCRDSELFFNSCGMEADLFAECKDPNKRILSK